MIRTTLATGILVLCAIAALPAPAADALIIGMYQNCRLVSHTVVVSSGVVPDAEAASATAEAERVTPSPDFDAAVGEMINILERHGIKDIEVQKRGYAGCQPRTSGKFVEAVASYCGNQLTSAEIRVDGKVLMRNTDPDVSLDAFIDRAMFQLREQGIWDRPRVTVSGEGGCGPQPAEGGQ